MVQTDQNGPSLRWAHQFPPRDAQTEILEWAEKERHQSDVLIVEAPTGVGKSPICTSFAKSFGGAILTPQITLQEQYMKDFPWLSLVKGSSNYTCHKTGKDCKASSVLCKMAKGKVHCPYAIAKAKFLASSAGTTNYAYLFAIIPILLQEGNPLENCEWLILDEGHHLEPQLIESASIHITEEFCKMLSVPFTIPDDREDMWKVMEGVESAWRSIEASLYVRIDHGEVLNEQEQTVLSLIEDISSKWSMIKSLRDQHEYVYYRSEEDSKTSFYGLKPVFAHGAWDMLIKPLQKKLLVTSATILDPDYFADCLGIDDYSFKAVDSPFNESHRKIFYRPKATLNFRNMAQELPKVVTEIDRILAKFGDYKGIIHSHSFKLASNIEASISPEHRWRLLVHKPDSNREELLKRFTESDKPLVLVSPSMTEGVDLKYDLGRFSIFPKVPYPSLGDEWVKARTKADDKWYAFQVAKSIIQGSGRVCRSEDDWGYTYILDGSFERVLKQNLSLFPDWFTDAIR